jgi:triosephosphate isomerase
LQFWRSVFERRAPKSLPQIEQTITPIKQGKYTSEISDELLEALAAAYKEAVGRGMTM